MTGMETTQQAMDRAAEAMMAVGLTFRDMGFGFHVDRYGAWMSPAEAIRYADRYR